MSFGRLQLKLPIVKRRRIFQRAAVASEGGRRCCLEAQVLSICYFCELGAFSAASCIPCVCRPGHPTYLDDCHRPSGSPQLSHGTWGPAHGRNRGGQYAGSMPEKRLAARTSTRRLLNNGSAAGPSSAASTPHAAHRAFWWCCTWRVGAPSRATRSPPSPAGRAGALGRAGTRR